MSARRPPTTSCRPRRRRSAANGRAAPDRCRRLAPTARGRWPQSLGVPSPHPPVPAERRAELDGGVPAVLAGRPLKCGAEVGVLAVQHPEMLLAVAAAHARFRGAGRARGRSRSAARRPWGRPRSLPGARRRRRHGLEHREPGAGGRLPSADDQVLGLQPIERVDPRASDRLRRFDRGAADEDREAREARPLVGLSRSWLQAMVARSVRWRSGASRSPGAKAPSAASRRSAISAGVSSAQRAAASSIPSGRPSTRRQMSASVKSPSTARTTSSASRVLPTPPAPVSVSSLMDLSRRRAAIAAIASARPTVRFGFAGSVWWRRGAVSRSYPRVAVGARPGRYVPPPAELTLRPAARRRQLVVLEPAPASSRSAAATLFNTGIR
jgi:hypothetical protein